LPGFIEFRIESWMTNLTSSFKYSHNFTTFQVWFGKTSF